PPATCCARSRATYWPRARSTAPIRCTRAWPDAGARRGRVHRRHPGQPAGRGRRRADGGSTGSMAPRPGRWAGKSGQVNGSAPWRVASRGPRMLSCPPMRDADLQHAIAATWRDESPKVIAALVRMVRDLDLAEELAQDALVTALER